MKTENDKIEEIRSEIRKCEKAIAQAGCAWEAEMWKNVQSDYQRDLDEALNQRED